MSPRHADLSGLPPLLVFGGGREILFDPIREFVETARAQGVQTEFVVHPHMYHDWLITLPGGNDAMLTVEQIADFVHVRLDPDVRARRGLDDPLRHIE